MCCDKEFEIGRKGLTGAISEECEGDELWETVGLVDLVDAAGMGDADT